MDLNKEERRILFRRCNQYHEFNDIPSEWICTIRMRLFGLSLSRWENVFADLHNGDSDEAFWNHIVEVICNLQLRAWNREKAIGNPESFLRTVRLILPQLSDRLRRADDTAGEISDTLDLVGMIRRSADMLPFGPKYATDEYRLDRISASTGFCESFRAALSAEWSMPEFGYTDIVVKPRFKKVARFLEEMFVQQFSVQAVLGNSITNMAHILDLVERDIENGEVSSHLDICLRELSRITAETNKSLNAISTASRDLTEVLSVLCSSLPQKFPSREGKETL